MKIETYLDLKEAIVSAGYGDEIDWSDSMKKCDNAIDFWMEYSWVVINSGMKNQVAQGIWDRVLPYVLRGGSAHDCFGHKGKCGGIDEIWRDKLVHFNYWKLLGRDEDVDYLLGLPWIGEITKWHLAKNLGADVVKPDRHLVRIASAEGTTPHDMCLVIHCITGDRLATVDTVIWRAANLGLI